MSYIMTDYENITLSDELEAYLTAHAHEDDSLVQGARDHFEIFELAVEAWTKRAGTDLFQYTIPSKIQHADTSPYPPMTMPKPQKTTSRSKQTFEQLKTSNAGRRASKRVDGARAGHGDDLTAKKAQGVIKVEVLLI
ncbi:hypothetical protein AC1031_000123 [Aphanomyces cochlioides]|nr:hypothetical protein AC1031_000123 [Aphanomyces cochlioides]